MDFSLETIRIIFLLIPGIIASFINDKLVDVDKKSPLEFSVSTIVFSFLSYAILELIGLDVCIFNYVQNEGMYSLETQQVLYATGISIVISLVYSLSENKYWLVKFFNFIRLTNIIGEKTIFKSVVNDKDVLNNYVTVRDLANDLMYDGVLVKFAEIDNVYELYLALVAVYKNSTGEKLYELDRIYINTDFKNITLEVREIMEVKENG